MQVVRGRWWGGMYLFLGIRRRWIEGGRCGALRRLCDRKLQDVLLGGPAAGGLGREREKVAYVLLTCDTRRGSSGARQTTLEFLAWARAF